ncbi:hypothetical protein ACMD2_22325 [Ananas comosus]|uniref:Uncharacterized protein n=1 Tax=Ananas comosus TaxID=4615 RepID=A0A199W0C3_ANACO|nr:hypothetical protein ACMD2_22325 [Ananas comosus]
MKLLSFDEPIDPPCVLDFSDASTAKKQVNQNYRIDGSPLPVVIQRDRRFSSPGVSSTGLTNYRRPPPPSVLPGWHPRGLSPSTRSAGQGGFDSDILATFDAVVAGVVDAIPWAPSSFPRKASSSLLPPGIVVGKREEGRGLSEDKLRWGVWSGSGVLNLYAVSN